MRIFRSTAVSVLALVGAFVMFVVWTFRSQFYGTAIPVEEIYESLITYPIPAAVTQLQGARSDSMQGYQAYLRFRAPSPLSAGLTSPLYEPVDCADILSRLVLPEYLDSRFTPEWLPPSSPETCLQRLGLQGDVTNFAAHSDGWVHFSGSAD